MAPWKSLRIAAKQDQYIGEGQQGRQRKKEQHNVLEISFSVVNTFHISSKNNGNKGITLYIIKIKKLTSTQTESVITLLIIY